MMNIKRVLAIGACITLLGAIIFGGAMVMAEWNFGNLITSKMQTKDYEISENFSNIEITDDTTEIDFVPSDDGKCKVVCYERIKEHHSVKVENGTLVLLKNDERAWYDHFNFGFSTPKITVYLPAGEYGALEIVSKTGDVRIAKEFEFESIDVKLSTGDVGCLASASKIKIEASTGGINIRNISAGSLELSVSTGDVSASDVVCTEDVSITVSTGKTVLTSLKCASLTTTGDTGDITLNSVITEGKLTVERSTGYVRLIDSDAGEISIKTSTGDVKGTLLSDKIFMTKTSTGDIDVPKSTTGGICEITTNTGDIEITVK